MNSSLSRVVDIDINDILPNRNQPRIILNEEDDLGLTDSVKEYGVLQPIIVRSIGDKYEIIAGERRYRASVLAGKPTVPALIINMNDKESAEVALIENVQRKELSPIEEALSYKKILDLGYMTQEQLAEKIGKSQPSIANKIRLLNLSDEVQDALLENKISERHARSLLKLKTSKSQNYMLDKIINERLTVRKTDEEIDKYIKEKGEENMNNELNNMPQFQTIPNGNVQPMPQFDMFQSVEPQPVAPTPVAEPVQPVTPQFNIFADNSTTDTSGSNGGNTMQPTIEPQEFNVGQQAVTPAVPQFDIFQNAEPVQATTFNVEPAVQPVESTFSFEPAPQPFNLEQTEPVQTVNNIIEPVGMVENTFVEPPQFDIFQNAEPVQAVTPAAPQFGISQNAEPVQATTTFNVEPQIAPMQPIVEPVQPTIEPIVPVQPVETTPVVEQPQEPITTAPVQESGVEQETSIPEPIIITDYNKQYDPVMPQEMVEMPTQREFKDVVAAIRECAAKIESYGYKIDVDEFDLTNIYQAIFKIEKM